MLQSRRPELFTEKPGNVDELNIPRDSPKGPRSAMRDTSPDDNRNS